MMMKLENSKLKNEPWIIKLFKKLGPGIITGASDDDPSGIATYSQAGAQFGYSMLWTMVFTFPLMSGIQEISARIGRVSGRGIAGNICKYYSTRLAYSLIFLLIIANTINIGADLGAMGSAVQILVGGPVKIYIMIFTIVTLLLQVFIPYSKYVKYLKWLTLTLFCYIATAFFIHIPWKQVALATFLPKISFTHSYLTTFAAILGTTISPYLFFWQASEEVEELNAHSEEKPIKIAPQQAAAQFERIKVDTYIGMAFSNLIAFFIILTTAATLHIQGTTDIQTAAQAAQALEPVAGHFSSLLFAFGIIGTGLLAIPILAGSTAYGVGEVLKCRTGLELRLGQAKIFYTIIAVSLLAGMSFNFLNINPMKALFWSAILNGVVAVPLMIVMMLMTNNAKVMGQFVLSGRLRILGWSVTIVMFFAALGLFISK